MKPDQYLEAEPPPGSVTEAVLVAWLRDNPRSTVWQIAAHFDRSYEGTRRKLAMARYSGLVRSEGDSSDRRKPLLWSAGT
jgi:predicted transcriptional regulator